MNTIKTYKKGNLIFRIRHDEFAEKPKMHGVIYHWHPRYNLGTVAKNRDTIAAIRASRDWAFFLPLYLYDHGQIALSLTPFVSKFDSGQVGFIAMTKEERRRNFPDNSRNPIKQLEQDLETFTAYLNGEVYEWDISSVDDCGGYYGIESWEQMKADAGVDETWEEVNP